MDGNTKGLVDSLTKRISTMKGGVNMESLVGASIKGTVTLGRAVGTTTDVRMRHVVNLVTIS